MPSSQQEPRPFDPSQHKAFLLGSILDKETKIRQQTERFSLLDELIRESEKKSKSASILDSHSILGTLFSSSSGASNANAAVSSNAIVDLNDIYCHFPEMCTHHLQEVEDFTFMCCQLFQLEETIKAQKHKLNALEFDLQKELTTNTTRYSIIRKNKQNKWLKTLKMSR